MTVYCEARLLETADDANALPAPIRLDSSAKVAP